MKQPTFLRREREPEAEDIYPFANLIVSRPRRKHMSGFTWFLLFTLAMYIAVWLWF